VTLALAAGWRQLTRRRVALAVAGVALAAGVVVAVGTVRGDRVWEQVAARVRQLGDGAGRLELWRAAWAMAGDRPLTGVGLDCFHLGYARHRSLDYWRLEWNVTPPKAHNEALHVLATQGIFGVVAGLVLTGGLAVAARRAVRRTDSADGRLLLAAIGAGVVGFYVQGLFSFTVAATGSLFVTLAAVLSRLGDGMQSDEAGAGAIGPGLLAGVALAAGLFAANAVAQGASAGPPWWATALILGGAAAAAVVALLRRDGAASLAWPGWRPAAVAAAAAAVAWPLVGRPFQADCRARAADRLVDADPAKAVAEYEAAIATDPGRDVLWSKLSLGAWAAAGRAADATARQRLGLRARAAAEQAVRLVPADSAHRAALGRILTGLARSGAATPTEALAAYEAAVKLDPQNPVTLAAAGEAAGTLGRPDLAREYLRRGLALDPAQASLHAGLGVAAMAEGKWQEASDRLVAAFASDWHGDLNAQLNAMALWAACLVQLQRPDMAEAVAREVLRLRPDWLGPRYTLAAALAGLGRPEAAGEYQAVAAAAPDHPFAAEARRWLRAHHR
jgi:tetratricopeptide (TPR) repeat protein